MDDRHEVREFRPSLLSYSLTEDGEHFQHNFDRDLHLFVIWENARHAYEAILSDLDASFSIRSVIDIQWSGKHLSQNSMRLYKKMHLGSIGAPSKIGNGRLIAIVVEDPEPVYAFDRSVSGLYECVNVHIILHKKRFRSWFDTKYAVHSTNSLGEFFEQAPLLLGVQRVDQALRANSEDIDIHELHADTAGVAGWNDFDQLFEYLNLTTNSIVLRGFEPLPSVEPGLVEELDILCEDLPSFVAAANALVSDPHSPHKCLVSVGGHAIRVDARYVGDGYYDATWERDLLRNQTLHNEVVPRPRRDDYFFSLLYHAKIHKDDMKPRYRELLPALANSIGLSEVSACDVCSDQAAAKILTGYMKANGYRYRRPLDPNVGSRAEVLRYMRDVMPERSYRRRRLGTRIHALSSRVTPAAVKAVIPKTWKTRFARALRRRA